MRNGFYNQKNKIKDSKKHVNYASEAGDAEKPGSYSISLTTTVRETECYLHVLVECAIPINL